MNVETAQVLAVLLIACTLCIPAAATSTIPLEYYHMDRCPDCKLTDPLIADVEGAYDGALAIERIDVETVDGWERWNAYEFLEVPAVVINGTVKIPKEEITEENLRAAIEQSLAGAEPQENSPPINWDIPFAFSLGLSGGSGSGGHGPRGPPDRAAGLRRPPPAEPGRAAPGRRLSPHAKKYQWRPGGARGGTSWQGCRPWFSVRFFWCCVACLFSPCTRTLPGACIILGNRWLKE